MIDISKIKIKKVTLVSFKFNTPENYVETKKYEYIFDVSSNFRVNKGDKLIDIILDVKISLQEIDTVELLFVGEIKTSIIYNIDNFDELVIIEESNLRVNDELVAKLVSISIATTRGMLVIKSTGSLLKNVYLPIIDPEDFLKNPVYKLNKQ